MQFTPNVGSADRIVRLILGAALIIMALTGTIGAWGWLGLILLGTAFMKFCPVFKIFGIKSTKEV
ncbi:DUF2892 domain-containing protein [Rhodobacteraceae bacterium]|nr:DUF2892 domain-containing protein [Paracoccaceae bacterium]